MAAMGGVKMMTTDMGIDAMRAMNRTWVNDARKELAPIWPTYMSRNSNQEYYQEYSEMGGFGDVPHRDEGDYINFATMDNGDIMRIVPEVRQLAFAITKEDRRFNRINKVERATKMLTRAARRTMERIAAYPFNVSTNAGLRVTMDGAALISNAHVLLNGATANNLIGAVDINIANLETGLIAFSTIIDNDGTYIDLAPKYLLVTPFDAPAARRALQSQVYFTTTTGPTPLGSSQATTVPDTTASRGVGNYTVQAANLILVVNPYLTDPDAWYLLADKNQQSLEFVTNLDLTDRSFIDPYTQDYVYSIEFSAIAGTPSWMGIMGATGG